MSLQLLSKGSIISMAEKNKIKNNLPNKLTIT